MKLKDYLDSQGISQNAFSKELNVEHSAVCHWIKGIRVPSKKYLRAIEKLTFGKVTSKDFQKS